MTIVFLCRLFYPHIGGVEKHVREVGKRLVSKGHKLIVITESSEEVYAKGQKAVLHERIDGMEIYRIPVGKYETRKKWVIWKWMWQHKHLLEQADIIHAHDVFFWYLPFIVVFPYKKIYTTFHGYESYPIRRNAIAMRKIAERLSAGNICIGDFMKKWYKTKPSSISYGGVTVPKEKHTSPKKESALFWGRLDNQTGILTYQAAIDIISKKFTQFNFTIIGEGEMSKKINHRFLRLNFHEDVSKYLENAHFAFVSRYLSILEALAAKRLVFAVYDNPVKEDYLKMASFAPYIVIAKDETELAERVIYFLKNPTHEKQLIDKGYEWVKKQTWEDVVSVYEKLWATK